MKMGEKKLTWKRSGGLGNGENILGFYPYKKRNKLKAEMTASVQENKLNLCEGGRFSAVIFNSDNQLQILTIH